MCHRYTYQDVYEPPQDPLEFESMMRRIALLLFFLQSFFSKLNAHWHHNILKVFGAG